MDKNGWFKVQEQPPTEKDGDAQKCVICWHMYNGVMVQGIYNIMHSQMITHWRRMPPPPEEYLRERKEQSI